MCVILDKPSPDYRDLATSPNKLSLSILEICEELDRLLSGACTWTLASVPGLKGEYGKFSYQYG